MEGITKMAPEKAKANSGNKLEKLEKNGYGGKRKNSGRKPMEKIIPENVKKRELLEMLADHPKEEIEVVVTNKKTGEIVIQKKTRLLAIMEMLADKALRDKDVQAAKEYNNRVLGLPFQSVAINHSGTITTNNEKQLSEAERAAAEAYHQYGGK